MHRLIALYTCIHSDYTRIHLQHPALYLQPLLLLLHTQVATIQSKFSDPPEYLAAAKIFEELGRSCTATRLLAMNAKGYFLQSGLCLMAANDTVAARIKIDEFKSLDYTFGASRECTFMEDLCQAMETFDSDGFATTAFEYDKTSTLDPWKTTILVTIKRLIEGGGSGSGGEIDLT
jgi:alpha-soluble NSF attachment protein